MKYVVLTTSGLHHGMWGDHTLLHKLMRLERNTGWATAECVCVARVNLPDLLDAIPDGVEKCPECFKEVPDALDPKGLEGTP